MLSHWLRLVALLLPLSVRVHAAWAAETTPTDDEPKVGETQQALPGVANVPLNLAAAPQLNGAMDAGYGITESQRAEGAHHRWLGSLGIGLIPLPGLQLAVLGGVRYDRHPRDGIGVDSGTISQAAAIIRWGTRVTQSHEVGVDLGTSFAGSENLGDTLKSPTIDLRALFGWTPMHAARIGGFAGYRLDRSSGIGANADHYRAGDRLALGLSNFNAALVGVGLDVPIKNTELLVAASADLLLGKGAPSISESPIRLNVGARQSVSTLLQFEILTALALSARPDITVTAPLVPIEPRFTVLLGARVKLWGASNGQSESAVIQAPVAIVLPSDNKVASVPTTAPEPVTETTQLTVTVVDPAGNPISDAVVNLRVGSDANVLAFDHGSTYVASAAGVGHGKLLVHAELMRDWEQDVELIAKHPLDVRVQMVGADLSGQIRGLVRAFDGRTLPAHVRIEPAGIDAQANDDGSFRLDVSPGKYRVRVWLNGYQTQERNLEVRRNGVTVLNVDMQKGQ